MELAANFVASKHQSPLDAVIIRNLSYEVGRGSGKKLILNKISLTVPEGSIYGLLGPSGCGKTTMLRCVVGRIRAKSGQVMVFGCRPGDRHSRVPGRDVGYMPQEISIYEDFTIEETLIYFGKINRMHELDIRSRVAFLIKFLDLPSKKRLVVNLSGGQKRRVSLAAALVHSPPLLILDEPTVGVDPLLRQSIWRHLVTLTQTERISVIITTHYIEEARQANVVGLMRHGRILAENSPEDLMQAHGLTNLEDVFLKLCVSDTSEHRRNSPSMSRSQTQTSAIEQATTSKHLDNLAQAGEHRSSSNNRKSALRDYEHRWNELDTRMDGTRPSGSRHVHHDNPATRQRHGHIRIETNNNKKTTYNNADVISSTSSKSTSSLSLTSSPSTSSDEFDEDATTTTNGDLRVHSRAKDKSNKLNSHHHRRGQKHHQNNNKPSSSSVHIQPLETNPKLKPKDKAINIVTSSTSSNDDYLALQAMSWAARRSSAINLMSFRLNRGYVSGDLVVQDHQSSGALDTLGREQRILHHRHGHSEGSHFAQWWKTLMAVTWKNYIRLRRNPPVLVFQFMLPAIQVILFCLCIGGEPFDVPVAIVNEETVPRASLQFLDGLNKQIIRQVKYDNLTSAIEAVRKGHVWGAIHIPDKYSENLQSRLIMGEEVNPGTVSNGTIKVYPDLTNLHLALALENTFRETFIKFARNSLEHLGYDKSLADLPIQIGKPVYGTINQKDSYLEFMAPGVVISISYVMATGLTALAFILERRDGLLERSLVSGVETGQILLAHAINQVVVMIIQIFMVLGCTFFVFEIPSRGPFFWVVLLILLQGCTGMGFGLLVSAICKEENTAVMMLVGTFYTNLILAGIIWPIEAMPHWLRPLSYAQPQTIPTDSLRHILSRGWGVMEPGVLLGFSVTIGWLVIFLLAAGLIFKYSG